MDIISEKFKIPVDKIHKNQIKFYHINETKYYIPNKLDVLLENIKAFDYFTPIKKLGEYYGKENYYNLILTKYNLTNKIINQKLEEYNNLDPDDLDEILLNYVQCRKNLIIIISLNKPVFSDNLNKKGNIYSNKNIEMSGTSILNLLFLMNNNKINKLPNNEIFDNTERYYNKLNIKKFSKNWVNFVFFDNINNISHDEILNLINEPIQNKNYILTHDFPHMTEIAKTILNKNSLEFLENTELKDFLSRSFHQCFIRFQTFRKFMYEQLNLFDINRICIYGGTLLYLMGFRKSFNIEGFMVGFKNKKEKDIEIEDEFYANFYNDSTKFDFINIGIENSKYWENSNIKKIVSLVHSLDINDLTTINTNPTYHMYINGIKFCAFNLELIRKINRIEYVNQDIADIIMIYFYKRLLLGHYVFLDRNNKLSFHEKFGSKKIRKTPELLKKIKNFIDNRYLTHKSKTITERIIDSLIKN
jgi:hypothetical protein